MPDSKVSGLGFFHRLPVEPGKPYFLRCLTGDYENLDGCWAGFTMDSEEHLFKHVATKSVYQPLGFRQKALWMFRCDEVADTWHSYLAF